MNILPVIFPLDVESLPNISVLGITPDNVDTHKTEESNAARLVLNVLKFCVYVDQLALLLLVVVQTESYLAELFATEV
jgi:hypothetical protein